MVAITLPELDRHTLAQLLFASPVQPSEHPSQATIRKAVAAQFRRCHGDMKAVLAAVAQEAGDHPDSYVTRMKWAIRSVSRATAVAAAPSWRP